MKQPIFALVLLLALILAAATPSFADSHAPKSDTTEQQAIERQLTEGFDEIMDGLRLMLKRIPQYDPPEILPNGDIIIRRRNGPTEAPEEDDKDTKKL